MEKSRLSLTFLKRHSTEVQRPRAGTAATTATENTLTGNRGHMDYNENNTGRLNGDDDVSRNNSKDQTSSTSIWNHHRLSFLHSESGRSESLDPPVTRNKSESTAVSDPRRNESVGTRSVGTRSEGRSEASGGGGGSDKVNRKGSVKKRLSLMGLGKKSSRVNVAERGGFSGGIEE